MSILQYFSFVFMLIVSTCSAYTSSSLYSSTNTIKLCKGCYNYQEQQQRQQQQKQRGRSVQQLIGIRCYSSSTYLSSSDSSTIDETYTSLKRRTNITQRRSIVQLAYIILVSSLFSTGDVVAAVEEEEKVRHGSKTDIPVSVVSITPCKKQGSGGSGAGNCISTSSVRQVDQYSTPWTWSDDISVQEVIGRLKGAITTLDGDFQIIQTITNTDNDEYYIRAIGTRNVIATDEIEFRINQLERIITYKSQQISGPDNLSDFGKIRQRLNDIRTRTKVLQPIGSIEFGITADTAPRPSGVTEQLKTFWGFQSGSGYEDILLE